MALIFTIFVWIYSFSNELLVTITEDELGHVRLNAISFTDDVQKLRVTIDEDLPFLIGFNKAGQEVDVLISRGSFNKIILVWELVDKDEQETAIVLRERVYVPFIR